MKQPDLSTKDTSPWTIGWALIYFCELTACGLSSQLINQNNDLRVFGAMRLAPYTHYEWQLIHMGGGLTG